VQRQKRNHQARFEWIGFGVAVLGVIARESQESRRTDEREKVRRPSRTNVTRSTLIFNRASQVLKKDGSLVRYLFDTRVER
jgi:hypothetical protein